MAAQIQGPDLDYKPWGGLAGVYSGERTADQSMANQLALQEAAYKNTVSQKDAQLAQEQMNTPEWAQTQVLGQIGKSRGEYADGQLKYSTLDANTKNKLQELKNSTSAGEIQQTISGIDQFITQATVNGPVGISVAAQSLPAQYQQMVAQLEQKEPGSSVKHARQIRDLLVGLQGDTPTVRGKMQEQAHQGTITAGIHASDRQAQKDIAGMNIGAQRELEQMRIDAGKYNKAGTAKTVEELLLKAPNAKAKAEVLESAQANAIRNGDMESAISYQTRAEAARARAAEDASNTGLASKQTGIDIAAKANLPTNPAPSANAPVGNKQAVIDYYSKLIADPNTPDSLKQQWILERDKLQGTSKPKKQNTFNEKTGKWE